MEWNDHWRLEGRHATLSPSGYHWLNYDPDKMRRVTWNNYSKEDGTKMHELASNMILYSIMPENNENALNQFVIDALTMFDEPMSSEILLYYSDECFGTADAIYYDEEKKHLQVHDLKTGVSKPSFKQLWIYCALFCLEYDKKPEELTFECRLYQLGAMDIDNPDPKDIRTIMNQIVSMSNVIEGVRIERRMQGFK